MGNSLSHPIFSGKWATQVFDSRGIRHPGWSGIDATLCQVGPQEQASLFEVIGRMGRGVESDSDFLQVERFLKLCRDQLAHPVAATPSAADFQSDEVDSDFPYLESVPDDLSWLPPMNETVGHMARKPGAKHGADAPADPAHMREHGLHIYGSKAALKAELDSPKDRSFWLGKYTVAIELAPTTGLRRYDWDVKLSFQITRRELPVLASFLMGFAGPELSFGNHGPDRNKTLDIEDQGTHLFLKLRQGHSAFGIPISALDHYGLSALVLTAMRMNSPELDGPMQLALLKRVGDLRQAMAKTAGNRS